MSRLKLVSWNVNGLRAILKKGDFLDFIAQEDPDVICIQETKMQPGQATLDLPDYEEFWCSAARRGYSGVATFVRKTNDNGARNTLPKTISLAERPRACRRESVCAPNIFNFSDKYGTPIQEGRLLTLDLGPFYLVNTYVPNSKPDLSRLPLRYNKWDPALKNYLKNLEKTKPVVVCGDFNAAHTPIDLARPKENEMNAGFTKEEREGITALLGANFIDTFRALHPDKIQYSWWSMRGGARIRNIGWRIDYFFISKNLIPALRSAAIHDDILGSDHAPISITLELTEDAQ